MLNNVSKRNNLTLISLVFVIQVAHCAIEVVVQYQLLGERVRTLVCWLVVVMHKEISRVCQN